MTTSTIDVNAQAIETLERMKEIARNEMLASGVYASSLIEKPELAGKTLCNGRRYCAIGAVIIADGVKSHRDPDESGYVLRNDEFSRLVNVLSGSPTEGGLELLYSRPSLKAAHEALCDVAEDFAAEHDLHIGSGFASKIEGLIEGDPMFEDGKEGGPLLLDLIERAQDRLRRSEVE